MTINKSMLSHTNKVQAEEIAALRAEVERLKQNPEGYWRGQWAQEAQLRVAAESQVEALKKERDDFKWKYENESNRIGATRLAEINALRARSEAAESAVTRLKAERDEAMAAGYAQGVAATEARASKRIAELEADYERVQKLSSDAGSKGHKLLAELTRLREREKVLVEALDRAVLENCGHGSGYSIIRCKTCGAQSDVPEGRPITEANHRPGCEYAALSAEPEGKNVAP